MPARPPATDQTSPIGQQRPCDQRICGDRFIAGGDISAPLPLRAVRDAKRKLILGVKRERVWWAWGPEGRSARAA